MPRSPVSSSANNKVAGSGAVVGDVLSSTATKERLAEEEEEEDEDEDEILETSENGRWQKINEQVTRDVPGIDAAFLAMDTDDGVEVVWNEVLYSDRRGVKGKERLAKILQKLTEVKHNNIVNFIDFWHDKVSQKNRLVFITEYITSGSLLQFLKRTKKTKKTTAVNIRMWRRWCRQILSALCYLHKSEIIHGNLSLASIFIQHDGLVKIGSVSPDALHTHVKTYIQRKGMPFLHYAAPELSREEPIQMPADIYAFGICALEMLNLDLLGNGENKPALVNNEAIKKALDHLHIVDSRCQQFIKDCLDENPARRPSAAYLLKHPVLQEVFSLKVLSAIVLRPRENLESLLEIGESEDSLSQDREVAVLSIGASGPRKWKASQVKRLDLDKLFEEISQDIVYEPLVPKNLQKKISSHPSETAVPLNDPSSENNSSVFYEREKRNIHKITKCEVRKEGEKKELVLCLTMEDKLERELRSELKEDDDGMALANDLVVNGLISESDVKAVASRIDDRLTANRQASS